MTANDIPAPAPPQPPQPTPRPDSGLDPGRWSLLSDWLNPIVVREVQQALKGRAFVLSVMAALIVVSLTKRPLTNVYILPGVRCLWPGLEK